MRTLLAAALPTWALAAIGGGVFLILTLFILLLVLRKGGGDTVAGARPCGNCQRALMPQWDKCPFCNWRPDPGKGAVEFICGPLSGQTIRLEHEVTTIGSIGGNSIVLADPGVSRKHVGIRKADSGFELADLGSTNGVYVNGQRVAKRKLIPGDVIRVGTSEMVFRQQ